MQDVTHDEVEESDIVDDAELANGPLASAEKADAAELNALSASVRSVLDSAARIVAGRPGAPDDPDKMLKDPAGVRVLFDLLGRSPGLRAAVRADIAANVDPEIVAGNADDAAQSLRGPGHEADHDQRTAGALVSHEATACVAAAAALKATMSRARDEHRRAERRARRGTPEARALLRAQTQLAEARAVRDRARAQLEQAEAVIRDLRERAASAEEDLKATQATTEALSRQLRETLASARSIEDLSVTLAERLEQASVLSGAAAGAPDGSAGAEGSTGTDGAAADAERTSFGARLRAAAAAHVPAKVVSSVTTWLPAILRALAEPPQTLQPPEVRELAVAVEVLGGGEEIGGSCVLVTAGSTRILVDAGARPGGTTAAQMAPPRIREALAGRIDAIVVTHAHNDHAGWVPAIIREQPHIAILTTEATSALLATMWLDSAKVLSRRAGASNASSGPANTLSATAGADPAPYNADDVREALRRIVAVPYNARRRVGDLDVELFPAGHIVGAAGVVVQAGNDRIVVSGDVSRPGQKTVGGLVLPPSAIGASLLLLESTYAGQARQAPRSHSVSQFVSHVRQVTDAGGRVLVPAFALGRAQEIALILADQLPDVEVLVDGLAGKVSEVFERFDGPDGRRLQIFGGKVRLVRDTRAEVARFKTGVVVATSGMLTGGPAVRWAEALLPDPKAGLMVVGYQDEESPGRRLLDLSAGGGGTFELQRLDAPPVEVEVAAAVRQYGLGAHASADELVSITADAAAEQVMLVHGEPHGQRVMARRLELRGQRTVTPSRAWQGSDRRT